MTYAKEYAEQWDVSAKFFYEQGYYAWMAQKIEKFHTIVEIGCGTGYSTLALLEAGHKVIAIEKNYDCIVKAKKLLTDNRITTDNVVFIEGDIAEDTLRNSICSKFEFDAVLCWNTGSYWNKEMMEYYLPFMFEYGLTRSQIAQNPESSYSELILWETCRLAKQKNAAVHIVERRAEIITEHNDPYYKMLKDEFSYKTILYDNKNATSISKGGRILVTNGIANSENHLNIILLSILML